MPYLVVSYTNKIDHRQYDEAEVSGRTCGVGPLHIKKQILNDQHECNNGQDNFNCVGHISSAKLFNKSFLFFWFVI